jgi:hypothetical protein
VFAILESPNGNPWVDKPITIVTSPETDTEQYFRTRDHYPDDGQFNPREAGQ